MTDPALAFEPATRTHLPLLRRWLDLPHWRQWWGDPDVEFGYIVDMIEERDSTRPFLFRVGGELTGYIQYWFVGHHQSEEWSTDSPWLLELPADAIGVDISIGEADRLSRGIGSTVLRAFVDKLSGEGFETIVIDPDPHNLRAVRAYRKAGFEVVPHLLGRTSGVLIMQHHPSKSMRHHDRLLSA